MTENVAVVRITEVNAKSADKVENTVGRQETSGDNLEHHDWLLVQHNEEIYDESKS